MFWILNGIPRRNHQRDNVTCRDLFLYHVVLSITKQFSVGQTFADCSVTKLSIYSRNKSLEDKDACSLEFNSQNRSVVIIGITNFLLTQAEHDLRKYNYNPA